MVKPSLAALPAIVLILAGLACGPLAPATPATPTPRPVVTRAPATAGPAASQTPAASPAPAATSTPAAARPATPTLFPLPALSLQPGDFYFSLGGRQQFLFGRNITGRQQDDFDTLLGWTQAAGSRLVRLQLTSGWVETPWITPAGEVNEIWATQWDGVLSEAQAAGLYVIPEFGVWADWNAGLPNYGFTAWQTNPLNRANGGPVVAPGELMVKDSVAQTLWLKWVKQLVGRWQGRSNIAAWEIFSEVNLAAGDPAATDAEGGPAESAGQDFADRAAAVVRAADPQHRPLTVSLANTYGPRDPWANFYADSALDFIEIHPYLDQLDTGLVSQVGQLLARYDKPVLIGESGLSAYQAIGLFPDTAARGIHHAVWAGLVSGAMNGRALWWEDGYAVYGDAASQAARWGMMATYKDAERAAASFVQGVDFAGYQRLAVTLPAGSGVWGAAVGDEHAALGWFRDAGCEPPAWPLKPLLTHQSVTLRLPGAAAAWSVSFYSPATGALLGRAATLTRQGHTLTVPLPDFADDIAFKLTAQ